MGRAAYTSHFSVGLDVRSDLEDAEALAALLGTHASVEDALKAFDAARRPKAESLQRAARASQSWFEHVDQHIGMPFEQFVFALLTASMRMTYARVEKAAPELVRRSMRSSRRRRMAAATGRRRRCSRRSRCAGSPSPTASWCRRCACIRPRTAR